MRRKRPLAEIAKCLRPGCNGTFVNDFGVYKRKYCCLRCAYDDRRRVDAENDQKSLEAYEKYKKEQELNELFTAPISTDPE